MDSQQYHHHQEQQFKQNDRSRTKWTSSLDKLFVDLVLEQVLLGNRSNNVFNKIAWKHIRDEFNRQTGLDFNRKQLKKHLDVLRNRYDNAKSQFVPTTGFVGDMFVSGTDVWDDYIVEDYPMGETTKMKDFPIYDQLCKIFSEAGGIGRYAQSSHYIDIEKEADTQTQPHHSSCPKIKIDPSAPQDDSLNCKLPVKRKRNNGSGLLDQEAIAEAMMEMANASKLRADAALIQCSGDQFAITKCVEELDKISNNVDERLYYAALDLFDDVSMREMFLSLRADRRLVWLHEVMDLKNMLPPVKNTATNPSSYDHRSEPWFKQRFSQSESQSDSSVFLVAKAKLVPPYLKRLGFMPRKVDDFGDGGAFPEFHIVQYPLGMGRNKGNCNLTSTTLSITVDANGNISYDSIVKQKENSSKIVYSKYQDLVPQVFKSENSENEVESVEEVLETMKQTKAVFDSIVNAKNVANKRLTNNTAKIINYKPSQKGGSFNSGANGRLVKLVEMQMDPLEPAKFKHKKVPRPCGSPPVPVMHSPPRPVTVKDQQEWKIPPCISNWKNSKGYTIPLDKRLAVDGRGLQEVQINDNFASLSESLYVAEQKAREAISARAKLQKELLVQDKVRQEENLRALAAKARLEAAAADSCNLTRVEREERAKRDKIRVESKMERKRKGFLKEKNTAMGKKSKISRDGDREISEKVALGMANTNGVGHSEVMYDQRIFNQDKGMNSGFATDDHYNVYDKSMFNPQATLSTLYKPNKNIDSETYGGENDQLEKVLKTDRFKPDKGFSGVCGQRQGMVAFEEDDPFGLSKYMADVNTSKKALQNIGSKGSMNASAGSSMKDSDDAGCGRTRIGFRRGQE